MIVEGLIRVGIFIAYLTLISLWPDLRRVFQYHAAEHKAINAYEAGDPLEPETVQRHSLLHVRCGTAFLLYVMVIAIFVFAFFGKMPWYWLIISRILALPLIAGLAYEVIRFAGRHSDNRALRIVLRTGLWLQRLTTRQPTLDQIEVSIRALREVLRLEGQADPGGAQGRDHGIARARERGERHERKEPEWPFGSGKQTAVWNGSFSKGAGRSGRSGAFDVAVTWASRAERGRAGDEPRGADRGGARRVLLDGALARAGAGRNAAGGAGVTRRSGSRPARESPG